MLLVVAYGPNSEKDSDMVNFFKDVARQHREIGDLVEVISFDEYYKDFLDLENPNTNDIHLKRLLALNKLVIEAYDDSAAFERLHKLSIYYKSKLLSMGRGKTEYEAFYGV